MNSIFKLLTKALLICSAFVFCAVKSQNLTPNLSLYFNDTQAQTESYNDSAEKFFNYLATQPDASVKRNYNNLFVNYSDILNKSDRFYIRGAQYYDNAIISLKNPQAPATDSIGSPSFSQFGGFSGADFSAYDWNYTPSIDGHFYTKDSACLWAFNNNPNNSLNFRYFLGSSDAGQSNQSTIFTVPGSPDLSFGINGYAEYSSPLASNKLYYGLWSLVRKGIDVYLYHNGIQLYHNAAHAPINLSNFSMFETAWNVSGSIYSNSNYNHEIYASGACASTIDQLRLYDAVQSFMGGNDQWCYYGDSETSGFCISPVSDSWTYLLSNAKGKLTFNRAVSGSTTADFINNVTQIIPPFNSTSRIFFGWGVNDCVAMDTTTFKANLQTIYTMAISAGWTSSQIIYITGFYLTNAPVLVTYPNFILASTHFAESKGCQNYNLFPLAYTLCDDLHVNKPGSVTIVNYLSPLVH